ncbi:TM2 domain-containing protein [Methylobacter sp. S3L5C]|uniref:TM2 domain-containing protein n=1 Tax=Methylobacter sp. S3L5C TaxID=2839024 RepID=UPI001FADD6E1|nr:TM2 domain-containing protein [Methylobacter sp. S3L5C]UOA10071.1 TM2 domain-containing protein [Methylobacter sp. S3L5C]
MIGYIESYDADSQTGVVKSEKNSYTFHLDDWVAQVSPDVGDDVSFDSEGTLARQIKLVGAYLTPPTAVKYKYVAAVLALLLGGVGVHRFYLGYYKIGLMQLALTVATHGYGVLWGFIDAILLFGGHINKDAKGRPFK